MKNKFNYISSFGILGFIALTMIDRFITKIPDRIYIPTAILIITIILYGNIRNKRKCKKTR
jgi:hypothetical protein